MTKATVLRASQPTDIHGLRSALRTGASALVLGGMLLSTTAMAQDAEAAPEEDLIVVTGIRQSLASAQNIKRDSETVVDAITAEDIGALPDRSVTEALQRVPGIAINRFAGSNDPDHFSVEGSGVVIRGLNFVRSEFNGRTAFAAGVGGQALNFADVPAELLGSVIVSKNSTADMIEGGLAGTVNLITRKPLDRRGFHVAFSAEANYGDFVRDWSPTGSAMISNTWESDAGTFGLLVAGSYSQVLSRADALQITNFQTRDNRTAEQAFSGGTIICRNALPSNSNTQTLPASGAPCGTGQTAGADGFADWAPVLYAPVGGQFRTQDFNRQRDGIVASAQFETNDGNTTVTAEFIRSHSTNAWGEYTYETGPDLSEYSTYPRGCLQNANGPTRTNADGSAGDPTTRAECVPGQFTNYTYNDSGLFQSGYITNPSNGWRGDPGASPFVPIGGIQQTIARRQVMDEITNTDYSFAVESQLTDRLHLDLDLHYARSQKDNLDVTIYGSNFIDQELDLTGNLPQIVQHKPNVLGYTWSNPDPALRGSPELRGATEAQYFTDPRFQFWRSAMDHIEDSTGTQYALKADLEYEFSDDAFIRSVKVGGRYQDRDQDVRYTTYNWGMLSEVWSGSRPVNFADTPASATTRYDFPNFFRGKSAAPQGAFYYNGDLTGDYAGFVDFAQDVQGIARGLGASPSWVPLSGRSGAIAGTPYLPEDIQPLSQAEGAAYIMARFGSEDFAGHRIGGNVGLRYVTTDVESSGRIGVGTRQAFNIEDSYAVRCAATVPPGAPPGTQPQTPGGVCTRGPTGYAALQRFADGTTTANLASTTYDYWLPSFNLRFEVNPELLLRFAASKVLTRPDNAYLRNFLTLGLDAAGNLTANAGNPTLRPATAWQFDLTAEWYFDTVGSLTANLFYKRVNGFFYQAVTQRAITNNGVTENVLVRGPANFDGNGTVKGFEVAYQQTFDFLPGFLSGFGTSANYTYIESKGLPNTFLNGGGLPSSSTIPPGNLPLEQLSKHNVNVTAFYERGPISLRAAYNWRSRFLLTASDVIFPFFSIFNEPTGQLDASIFFNINENLRIGIQGVNLLDEVTKTTQAYTGDPSVLAPRSYFMNDRRYSFILRGQF